MLSADNCNLDPSDVPLTRRLLRMNDASRATASGQFLVAIFGWQFRTIAAATDFPARSDHASLPGPCSSRKVDTLKQSIERERERERERGRDWS